MKSSKSKTLTWELVMTKFNTIERRISANADMSRFRVQYKKKNGKANAKILHSLADARKLRDSTDTPGAAKKSVAVKRSYTKQKPRKEKTVELSQIDLSAISGQDVGTKKLDLLEKYLQIFERILAI